MSEEKAVNFLKNNLLPISVTIYFVRYIFPQGIYSFTLTTLFYYATIYLMVGIISLLGLIGIVGLINSRQKNTVVNPKHKSFIVTAALGLFLFGVSFATRNTYFHMKFDSELWKDTRVSMDFDSNLLTPRQRMMDDLVENKLSALTRAETISLLGNPNYSWESDEGGWTILYVVGPEKGLGVDYQCLEINFDKKDKYKGYTDIPICG